MPKLVLLAACERSLIDQAANSLSLINVLESLTLVTPTEIPPDTEKNGPLTWSLVALWLRGADDDGQSFRQRAWLMAPDGNSAEVATVNFTMDKIRHRVTIGGTNFAVRGPGLYTFMVELCKDGSDEVLERGEYPISVEIHVVEPPTSAPEKHPAAPQESKPPGTRRRQPARGRQPKPVIKTEPRG